jgi:hypothetical protein
MFVREKRIGAYRYLYLVETVREEGLPRALLKSEAVAAIG